MEMAPIQTPWGSLEGTCFKIIFFCPIAGFTELSAMLINLLCLLRFLQEQRFALEQKS